MGLFGMTSGLMTHLRMFNLTVSDAWFPNHKAKFMGTVFIAGGFFVGWNAGRFFYQDKGLKSLQTESHRELKAQLIIPKESAQ